MNKLKHNYSTMFAVYITPHFYILFEQIKPGFSTHQPISVTFKTPPKLQSEQMPQAYRVLERRAGSIVY